MLKRFIQKAFDIMTKVTAPAADEAAKTSLDKVHDGKIEKAEHKSSKSRKPKNVRYAMLLAYQGKQYFGMQFQKHHPTIESNVLDALLKLNWITPEQRQKPFDFFFQRAARTDRSVSAVRQICSMQLPLEVERVDTGAARINEHLPADIRVFGFRRTTPSFHSQKDCGARTYAYTLPTFAFAKSDQLTNASFRLSEETRKEVNEILGIFVGTHNFFNYTSKMQHEQAESKRYIISFECGEPFLIKDEFRNEEVEFVTLTVKGQSFILHHIRKMVGMMISVIREFQLKSSIQRSFENVRMDVPKAPGLGLVLERLHYDWYDSKFAETHGKLTNWGEEVEERLVKFKNDVILPEIYETEFRNQSMMQWLAALTNHNFIIDPEAEGDPEGMAFLHGAHKIVKDATVALVAQENVEATEKTEETEKPAEEAKAEEESEEPKKAEASA